MGSSSDWETMQAAVDVLDKFGVPNEKHVMSAHRTPDVTSAFASGAQAKGLEVIIAGAGGAAQMPGGISVATFAIGKAGATNAGLFAVSILANSRPDLKEKLRAFRVEQAEKVKAATLP